MSNHHPGLTPSRQRQSTMLLPPHRGRRRVDVFWAQHYVGADLLREEIERAGVDTGGLENIVHIWDSSRFGHGEYVSNIVAGPHPSAVIPTDHHFEYQGSFLADPLLHAVSYIKKCHYEKNCPSYINFSGTSFAVYLANLDKTKSTLIHAAGNWGSSPDILTRQSSKNGKSILVASLDKYGVPSHFTSYGESITISAPSHNSIRSYDFAGQEEAFGGTSGAAPLVTGTLGGFTLLSGYSLDAGQIKRLLKKTAILHPHLPASSLAGAGILNSYKIGQVAQRIKERCQDDAQCKSSLLDTEELYNFDGQSSQLFDRGIRHFPLCHSTEKITNTCGQAVAFNNIRRAAFLNPRDPKIWHALACIRYHHFSPAMGAEYVYYESLGKRIKKNGKRNTKEHMLFANVRFDKIPQLAAHPTHLETKLLSPECSLEHYWKTFRTCAIQHNQLFAGRRTRAIGGSGSRHR